MFENPYRPSPMCRTQLQKIAAQNFERSLINFLNFRMKLGNVQPTWVGYECPNCGSEVWINPFAKARVSLIGLDFTRDDRPVLTRAGSPAVYHP